ncbi:MAG TPA: rhomboid family intramembrane serine protease [Opitutaceae bacterium]
MLSDRAYMRDSYGRQTTSVITWMLCGLVAGFVIQLIFRTWFKSSVVEQFAALSASGLRGGQVWTLLSYALLHGGPLHLLGNGLAIFFLGRELAPLLGERRIAWLSVSAVVVGGLVWFAANYSHGGQLVGASAIAMAFLTVFACLFPHREITFLIFFIIPITVRPIWILCVLGGLDLIGFLFFEIPGGAYAGGIAHSAHIGGMIIGWLYFRYVHQREWRSPDRASEIELPRWFRKSRKADAPSPAYKVNLTNREDLKAEVDRILDKINSEGFGALTPEEKRLLDEAKDLLSRR